jgi:hypothetical protein
LIILNEDKIILTLAFSWAPAVIPATWNEAEIRRIAVQGQPRQIVPETPLLQNSQSKMD